MAKKQRPRPEDEHDTHDEIICFGLPIPVMHRIINTIGEEVRSGR